MYLKIKEKILEKINSGEYPAEGKIPSETSLAEFYRVSRMTVRQAIIELTREGYLYRIRGSGTFVGKQKKLERNLGKLSTLYEELRDRGEESFSHYITRRVSHADENIAKHLQINAGDKIIELKRIRNVNSLPLAYQEIYLVERLCPGLLETAFNNQSLYEVLENEYFLRIRYARQQLEAVTATGFHKYLKIKENVPLLLVKRTTYLFDDLPVEYAATYFRSDQYSFNMTLFR